MRRSLLLLATACTADPLPGEVAVHRDEVTVCAAASTVAGIDVSKWQGAIDWTRVAADGIGFAFIRTNHGLGDIDERFDANWAGAKASGVIRGAYQYFLPNEDAIQQADLLLERMGALDPGDLPPVVDVEERAGQSAATIAAKLRIWSDRVESVIGRKPIIYTGKYFWQDYVTSAAFLDNPLWIAQWNVSCPDLPAPWTSWTFHQTSATGSVAGIAGDVDTDLFNGSLDDLRTFAAGCGDACPRCEPIPAEGRVVDDADLCFDMGGSADSVRVLDSNGWDGRLRWTYTTDWEAEDNVGVWTLELAEAGRYHVEVYTPAPDAESTRAAYQVRHAGTVDEIVVDQTRVDGWSSLGELELAQGGDQWIRLRDNTGEPLAGQTQIVFDAVRLTRVSPGGTDPDPDPDPAPDPEPDPGDAGGGILGGCSAAPAEPPGGAGGLVLRGLALLLLLLARRSRSGS